MPANTLVMGFTTATSLINVVWVARRTTPGHEHRVEAAAKVVS